MSEPDPKLWNKLFRSNLIKNQINCTGVNCPCCNYMHMQQSGDPGIYEWTCPNCNYYYEEPEVDA